ncbi:MAG: hypothetical protein WEA09_04045 [Gemmatimonadota bacterium]
MWAVVFALPLWSPADASAQTPCGLGIYQDAPAAWTLLRHASSRAGPLEAAENRSHWPLLRSVSNELLGVDSIPRHCSLALRPLTPEVRLVGNSELPFSREEGPLWAGRGWNTRLSGGFHARWGRIEAIFAPEFTWSENRSHLLVDALVPERSPYSSPWHTGGVETFWINAGSASIDLPQRFGPEAVTGVHSGQSTLAMRLGGWTVGASTENRSWGPAMLNPLVLSANAPGFPHVFVQLREPLEGRFGSLEGLLLAGELRSSDYFVESDAGRRSLGAMALVYRPPLADDGLEFGFVRSLYGGAEGWGDVLQSGLDPLINWDRAPSLTPAEGEPRWQPEKEQLTGLWARWILPEDGFQVYGEWVRHRLPVSIKDLLTAPHYSQGYTLGAEWVGAMPGWAAPLLRLHGEVTNVEESSAFHHREAHSFYTSEVVPEGYTHRGRPLGASFGPGGSGQWLALDVLGDWWSVGLHGGRIRWETDAFYRSRTQRPAFGRRTIHAFDAQVFLGVRGALHIGWLDVEAEVLGSDRFNYYFFNPDVSWNTPGRVDFRTYTGSLTVRPRLLRH